MTADVCAYQGRSLCFSHLSSEKCSKCSSSFNWINSIESLNKFWPLMTHLLNSLGECLLIPELILQCDNDWFPDDVLNSFVRGKGGRGRISEHKSLKIKPVVFSIPIYRTSFRKFPICRFSPIFPWNPNPCESLSCISMLIFDDIKTLNWIEFVKW